MPSSPEPISIAPESLFAHADWVRALAAQLVADPSTAQDVEQEVWMRTLESPPRTAENPRGWLAELEQVRLTGGFRSPGLRNGSIENR